MEVCVDSCTTTVEAGVITFSLPYEDFSLSLDWGVAVSFLLLPKLDTFSLLSY